MTVTNLCAEIGDCHEFMRRIYASLICAMNALSTASKFAFGSHRKSVNQVSIRLSAMSPVGHTLPGLKPAKRGLTDRNYLLMRGCRWRVFSIDRLPGAGGGVEIFGDDGQFAGAAEQEHGQGVGMGGAESGQVEDFG